MKSPPDPENAAGSQRERFDPGSAGPDLPGSGKEGRAEVTDATIISARITACRSLLRLDAVAEKQISKHLLTRPYWVFLLELYLAELEGRTLFQSCLSTDEVASNVHRRAVNLARLGALVRATNPNDHRRTDLRLTPKLREALDCVFDSISGSRGVLTDNAPQNLEDSAMEPGAVPLDGPNPPGPAPATDLAHSPNAFAREASITLPPEILNAEKVDGGDILFFTVENNEIRIRAAPTALRRIWECLRKCAPNDGLAPDATITRPGTESPT